MKNLRSFLLLLLPLLAVSLQGCVEMAAVGDRKSTRLNSSH